jgi:flavin-dependent dehydrogenase
MVTREEGNVVVGVDGGQQFRAKYLLDASGQGAVVGRHLGTWKNYGGRHLQKVAYFSHFENVWHRPGKEAGHPYIVMCEECWFWLIPIGKGRTSIGMVTDVDLSKKVGLPANRMLAWGMSRCPAVMQRAANATGPDTNQIISNFSYSCRPFAGPGYFLLGDAATFLDPIFSSGVCLGMLSGREAATHVQSILRGETSPAVARRRYIKFVQRGTGIFFRLINQYYRHSFRELFLNGAGPLRVHSAVLSVLAGQVFPTIPWKLRWRLWFFGVFLHINRLVPLVPRRRPFSLMATEPLAAPAVAVGT